MGCHCFGGHDGRDRWRESGFFFFFFFDLSKKSLATVVDLSADPGLTRRPDEQDDGRPKGAEKVKTRS